jgi:hypothetical protein
MDNWHAPVIGRLQSGVCRLEKMMIPDKHVIKVWNCLFLSLFPSGSGLANVLLQRSCNVVCVAKVKGLGQINIGKDAEISGFFGIPVSLKARG